MDINLTLTNSKSGKDDTASEQYRENIKAYQKRFENGSINVLYFVVLQQ